MNRLDFIKHNVSRLRDPKEVEEEKKIEYMLNNPDTPYGGISDNRVCNILSYCIKHKNKYIVSIRIQDQLFYFNIFKKDIKSTNTFFVLSKDIFAERSYGLHPNFTAFLSAHEQQEINIIKQEIIKQGFAL